MCAWWEMCQNKVDVWHEALFALCGNVQPVGAFHCFGTFSFALTQVLFLPSWITLVLLYFVFFPLRSVANLKVRIMFGPFVGGMSEAWLTVWGLYVLLIDWMTQWLLKYLMAKAQRVLFLRVLLKGRFSYHSRFPTWVWDKLLFSSWKKKNGFFSPHYTWPAECLDSWRTRWSDSLSNTVCHADTEDKKSGAASILSALSAANRLQHVGHACGSKKDKSMFRGQVCKKLIKVRFLFLSVWVVRSRAVIPPRALCGTKSATLVAHINIKPI